MKKKFLLFMMGLHHKFYAKFGRRIVVNQTVENAQQILIIDPGACCTNLKLGISDERAEQLFNGVVKLFQTEKDNVDVAEKMGPECKHANELFFVSMTIMQIQQERRMIMSNPLSVILGALNKK